PRPVRRRSACACGCGPARRSPGTSAPDSAGRGRRGRPPPSRPRPPPASRRRCRRSAARGSAPPPSERRRDHGVDLRQVGGDLAPASALVAARPELAAGGPEVEAGGRGGVGAEGLALDREPALLGGEALVLPLPALARVAGAVDGRAAAGADPGPDLGSV